MLFRTADGYKLQVELAQFPRLGRALEKVAPQFFPPGTESASPNVLLPALQSLVAQSRIGGVYTSSDSGRQYPLFTPHAARPRFDLLAVPQQQSDALLLQILRPRLDAMEMEVGRVGGSVTITWRQIKLLDLVKPKVGEDHGVYILERKGKPLYVGITLESFRNRWNKRFQVLQQLDLPVGQLGNDILWLGTLSGFDKKKVVPILTMVEHALVRYLSERGPIAYRLSNQMLKRPFIPRGDITITNGETRPKYLPQTIFIPTTNGPYEFAPEAGMWQGEEMESWANWPN